MFKILVVEDDQKLRRLIAAALKKSGYVAYQAPNGKIALDTLDKEYIDLIISDLMMPEIDGYELASSLRSVGYNIPILVVTARETYEDKRKGFLIGVDDYMVKPVDVNEMILRVGALLRRAKAINERKLNFGGSTLNYDSLTVLNNEKEVLLPKKEFYVLFKLLSYPGRTFTRQQIMEEIWGPDSEADERTVDVHIKRLRERFEKWPDFEIVTVRGLGYKAVRKR